MDPDFKFYYIDPNTDESSEVEKPRFAVFAKSKADLEFILSLTLYHHRYAPPPVYMDILNDQ